MLNWFRKEQLPAFTPAGLLPPGDYPLTFKDIKTSHLVSGRYSRHKKQWDTTRRRELLNNLSIVVHQLWEVGIEDVFLGGSFVEDKPVPNDIDGYFICDAQAFKSDQLYTRLNAIDPHQAWERSKNYTDPVTGQKCRKLRIIYQVELVPSSPDLNNAIVRKELKSKERVAITTAFRKSREWQDKGIIHIQKPPQHD